MSRRTSRVAILDATLEVLSTDGLAGLSLEDVASTAGLSRQTLYRHFGSRDALIAAAILREEAELFEHMQAAAEWCTDLESALATSFAAGMSWAREHALLDRVLRTEPEALLPFLLTNDGPVLSAARPVVEELLHDHLPDTPTEQLAADADAVARLMVSMTIAPSGDDIQRIADELAALVCRGLLRR